jgi:hypothetical protein
MTTVYSYPGNRGKIYPSELANELPWTPGDLVGLAGRTGPNLLVFVDAPGQAPTNNPATLSDARLTGPGGAVELRTVDGMTSLPKGSGYPTLAPFISPGGFIIPVRPLAPASTYQAHVVVTFGGIQTPHDWSFTTLGADPHSRLSARFGRLTFRSDSQRAIRVSFARTGGGRAPPVTIRPGHSVKLKLPPGVWRACGHQSAAGRFAGYDGCLTVRVTGVPSLKLGAPSVSGGAVHLSLSFSAVLRGRSATLIVTPLWRRCSRPGNCRTLSGRPADSRIVLRRTSVTLPLPALEHGFRVEVRTSAFELDDAPWSAAHAVTSFIRR